MSMTMTQKILAAHAGLKSVEAGELIFCEADLFLANDITAPPAIGQFKALGAKDVWDKEKIALVPDHFVPNKDIQSAEQAKIMRDFAREQGIKHYYEIGIGGIEHVILPEKGLVAPGQLIIGADSHTCTYGGLGAFSTGVGSTDLAVGMATGSIWLKVPSAIEVKLSGQLNKWVSGKDIILYLIGILGVSGALYQSLEFCGEGVGNLTITDRLTIANMAIEAGAKNGIFLADEAAFAYARGKGNNSGIAYQADSDAKYEQRINIDLAEVPLCVSCPHLPSNVKPVEEVEDITIDQCVIGSCTNGRIEDLRQAAQILAGRKVDPHIRCLIMPGSQEVYQQAIAEGLMSIFVEAGAIVTMPTCGPCLGGHCGVLAAGERAVATTNRNFIGRMGHAQSEIYLSGPAVAAASAIAGRLCHPRRYAD